MKNQKEQTKQTKQADLGGKREFLNKAKHFLANNACVLLAGVIVLCIYVLRLFAYKVYPFGTAYTVASYDLSAQICPFIEHLFDVFDGKSSLFYSYAIAGGADVFGSLMYFFISPFSIFFLALGDGMVAEASFLVMALKLASVAIVGAWFAYKQFKNIPDYLCCAIGVLYAYCGYMFVANTYINWVDFLIYMPLLVKAFLHFVKTNKFLPFSLLMACCIYTCFSIACFSMLIVFPILIFYGILCIEKGRKSKLRNQIIENKK